MSVCEFEKIILDIIASFRMEGINISEKVIYDIKCENNVVNNSKRLVKNRGGNYCDNRRK